LEFTYDMSSPLKIVLKLKKKTGDEPDCTIYWGDSESDDVTLDSGTISGEHEYAEVTFIGHKLV